MMGGGNSENSCHKTGTLMSQDRNTYHNNRQDTLMVKDSPQANDKEKHMREEVGQWQPITDQNTAGRRS